MKHLCLIASCSMPAPLGFCNFHWQRMPEDLKERYLMVIRDDLDDIAHEAALVAIETEAEGETE